MPTTSPRRRRRGRSSLSAFMQNIATRTSLKAVISEVAVILTNVIPTIRTEIHGDLLSTLATCPAFHFQEVTIATVPVVATAKSAELTTACHTREFSLESSRPQIFGMSGPSPPGAPLAAGTEACPRFEGAPAAPRLSPGL